MKPLRQTRKRGRALFLAVFLLAFLGAIGARAVQLQLIQRERFYQIAEKQHRKDIPLVPKRGTIYSRNMKELAVTLEVDSLYAIPDKVDAPLEMGQQLARLVSVDEKKLVDRLSVNKSFVWVKRWLEDGEAAQAKSLFPGSVDIIKEGRRFYPYEELAGQILGFAGLDGQGLEGLEKSYDELLKGVPGTFLAEQDARGRVMMPKGLKIAGDVPGYDLVLTLDETLQYLAEKELNRGVAAARAKGGTVIIMEPTTGEVLALATWPAFNPNYFSRYTPSTWRIRAVTDPFEPGSTLKIFTVAAALEEGVFKREDMIYTEQGKFSLGNKVIHDVHPYGWLSLEEVVRVSSNIGAAKVGMGLGPERLYAYMKKFGFFEPSAVELKGEQAGLHQPAKSWSRLTVATVSFGQGIAVTPLQLANGYAALANGGLLMKPHLVKKVLDKNGRIIKETQPQTIRQVISEKTADIVQAMLSGATGTGGTGRQADIIGYQVAGKTGTAQKPSLNGRGYAPGKYTASFVGWVPASHPKFLILVVIDEPAGVKYGGVVAAPVFKAIAAQALAYLRVPPDRPEELPSRDKMARAEREVEYLPDLSLFSLPGEKGSTMPDFKGMSLRQALALASARGINIMIEGSGLAVEQTPEGGAGLKPEEVARVKFLPPSRRQ